MRQEEKGQDRKVNAIGIFNGFDGANLNLGFHGQEL